MRRRSGGGVGCWLVGCGVLAVTAIVLALLAVRFVARDRSFDSPPLEAGRETIASPVRPARRPAGRPANRPDPRALQEARQQLDRRVRESDCAGYRLVTDLAAESTQRLCDGVVADLDAAYRRVYGLSPVGRPAEAILLFAEQDAFRRFVARDGGAVGYAGYAVGARGFAALSADGRSLVELASTLAHELTHLLSRRALGSDLPPWLSEGLADGLGDTATPERAGSPIGLAGAELPLSRLRGAYRLDRVGSLERLARLRGGEFDSGTVSFDYEQSALFVRFLMSEPELRARFTGYLADLAAGERYEAGALRRQLGPSWSELDRRFKGWVVGG